MPNDNVLNGVLARMGCTSSTLADCVPSSSALVAAGGALALGYTLWEQIKFQWYRRSSKGEQLPGPSVVTPFLGGIVEMVKDPWTFWEKQRLYSFPGMSWNSIVGVFTIFVTDAALSRYVFSHNSNDSLLLCLHPNAEYILGQTNIAFMTGPDHKALRKSFLALFTRKALGLYAAKQDALIRRNFEDWVSMKQPFEIRNFIRDLNAETSQTVFVGPYLDDPAERTKFSAAYRAMTDGFLTFPLMVPGTAVWKGRQGRHFIVKVLTKAAARSKVRMAEGHEPECLLDFWTKQIMSDCKDAADAGAEPPFYAENVRIAETMMDFLFASQDASTASLCWTITLMAEHPDVLARVREEQARLRPDPSAPLTGEVLNEMVYTRQVVKEVLRYRPPAPMVPQRAMAPFKLTEDYTAPKGTLIIPSVVAACKQGYENPDKFDPDRFGPERQEDVKFASNYLVFGHGPHYCVGKEYANNHLCVFLSLLATQLDWKRIRSAVSDDTIYLPTLYPGDSIFEIRNRHSK
ncbi:hypothetical protein HYH03_018401 [Edaphochlamys debaryana]|uniref:sterol 22-desaturase n=1 Tax=Edaphochlamys debaryana TaxID=47281 RepID=A0A836BN60_9CHLO|nr:hypothetical protein HYH03_018401 [Edaphochlamys debaryana]|eukprot:KAG2482695.1 hypothetical protein HYH03_018401 [Edaphochlamys debaryana]